MAIEVILHIINADPVLGELDEMPKPGDTMLKIINPRFRDGRELHYIQPGVDTVFWPISQITFVEVLSNMQEDQIFGFVRD